MSSDQTERSYRSPRSASGFAVLPSDKLSVEQDVDSLEKHSFTPDNSRSSTIFHANHDQNNRNGHHSRSRSPLPLPEPENGPLSRISSLGAPDTDAELGVPIHRVLTAPGSPSTRGKREVKTANKLTRMGFSPAEQAGRGTSLVSGNKRFGAFKSLMQTFKGK